PDRVAVVEGDQAAGGVIPYPFEDLDRRGGAADREVADEQNVAVMVSPGEGMAAVLRHVRVLADLVLEEPEAGGRVAAVVEAVHAGVQDQVAGAGIGVGRGVSMGDIVLALRLAAGEKPSTLLDAQGILRAAARENVVLIAADRVGKEAARGGAARRTVGKCPIAGYERLSIGEDLVPVVCCRRRDVAVELEGGRRVDGRGDARLELFDTK